MLCLHIKQREGLETHHAPHTCNADTGLGLSDVARIAPSQKHKKQKGAEKSTFGLALFSCIQIRNTARNVYVSLQLET